MASSILILALLCRPRLPVVSTPLLGSKVNSFLTKLLTMAIGHAGRPLGLLRGRTVCPDLRRSLLQHNGILRLLERTVRCGFVYHEHLLKRRYDNIRRGRVGCRFPCDPQREAFSSIMDVLPETLKAIQALQIHQHDRRARGNLVASSRPRSNDAKPYGPESPSTYDLLVRARTGAGKTLTFLILIIEARVRAVENARQKRVLEDVLLFHES
ncbi:hypothetical protein EDD85DRAFT_516000 [Armillaria nabsnona]|nr:hypothetical protein EDD85DRAFT_516000 [Armillaria nabsnona]